MKKILFIMSFALIFSPILASAETIIVVDQNNVVRQQIYTQPMAPQVVYTQPQQVVVQQPAPVVVRERAPRNYYYDPVATGLLVGFTGAVVGHALFGHHHHGGHHGGHHRR